MKNDATKKFQRDMQKLLEKGYVLSIKPLANNSGLELFLSTEIAYNTAKLVCSYLAKNYPVKVHLYIKNNSIQAVYDNK